MVQTKLELIKIPLSRLLKIELPRFAERVIGIVERHDPEILKIKQMYDLLVGESANIAKLVDRYGPNPINKELYKFRRMRSLYISAIRFRLKVVIRENKSAVNNEVKIVRAELNHFFQNLELSKNDEMLSQKVTQFLAKVNTNAPLQTALESLSFMEHLDNLTSVHNSIQELLVERVQVKSKRTRETTLELMKSVLETTTNLMKQIEIAPLKNPMLDYTSLYFDLNDLLVEFRNLINKRVLFNKRKADEINIEKRETNGMTTTTQNTESTGRMTNLNVAEEELNGLKTQPEKKDDAAAMRSKSKQLPPVSDDEEV